MKKVKKSRSDYLNKKNISIRLYEKRRANVRRHRHRYKIPKFMYKKSTKKELIRRSRHKFRKELYKKSKYFENEIVVNISKNLGIEKKEHIDYFLNVAEQILDTKSKHVKLNISECDRIWPSAVSMICSLVEWSEIANKYNNSKNRLLVESTRSNDYKVNDYLRHCGFANYIKISDSSDKKIYSDLDLVKIRRELTKSNIEKREDEILELIELFCDYNDDELELFNSVVLTEIFNNVTEHGFSHKDVGWWILAQTHPDNGFVSLCVSDNGIGIKNSLATGPQKKHIKKLIRDRTKNGGELIRLATQENISGAITATLKEDRLLGIGRKYPRGARRGNGLRRIKDKCSSLGIRLNILSHDAYLMYDENGIEVDCGGRERKVFAGTMYHLVIPMQRG
jgi:ribosomal protein L25 (general stress protein Ctc)